MPLTVKWSKGISIEYGLTHIFFDPQIQGILCPNVFVTHAHCDHSKAMNSAEPTKYSTDATRYLWEAYGKTVGRWQSLPYGQRVRIDDIEVVAHNSGHILGSSMYEIRTPEGTIVYTGDILCEDTLTTKAAESVSCDVLITEATFGSPHFVFPPKDQIATQMVEWATDSIKNHKTPAFQTDALGNAQEIIRIFNTITTIPVTTHWSVTRMNQIYTAQGQRLDYNDVQSEEAKDSLASGECIYIMPKNARTPQDPKFDVALVSGWALWMDAEKKSFVLSDHADFPQLLKFVEETRPKTVLTCFGQNRDKTLAGIIEKKLGIEARPLSLIPNVVMLQNDEKRLKACEEAILDVTKMQGFVYSKGWIIKEMNTNRFLESEIMQSLERLVQRGILSHVNDSGDDTMNEQNEKNYQRLNFLS